MCCLSRATTFLALRIFLCRSLICAGINSRTALILPSTWMRAGIELAGRDIEVFQILALEPADRSAPLQIHKESALHLAEQDRILAKYLVLFGRDRNSRVIRENGHVLLRWHKGRLTVERVKFSFSSPTIPHRERTSVVENLCLLLGLPHTLESELLVRWLKLLVTECNEIAYFGIKY